MPLTKDELLKQVASVITEDVEAIAVIAQKREDGAKAVVIVNSVPPIYHLVSDAESKNWRELFGSKVWTFKPIPIPDSLSTREKLEFMKSVAER